MKANILYGIGDLRFADCPTPAPKAGEALVRVRACGICGSDIARVFTTGTYHFPTIPGHEFSGEVAAVGPGCDAAWVGRRVGVFPLIPCRECDSCRSGKYELCRHYDYLGSRSDGGFAEYVVAPLWNLLPLPDSVSFEAAAMLEPSSVALHALRQAGGALGKTVAIVGPGTIGMLLAMMARAAGAAKVILIGRTQAKLDFAREQLGIACTINSTACDAAAEVLRTTGGRGADLAVEGTGHSASMELCLTMAAPQATVLALGNPAGDISLTKQAYWQIMRRQLTLVGTWNSRYGTADADWPVVLGMMADGSLPVEKLITHRLPLARLAEGLRLMRDKDTYTNKVMTTN